jgi:hypothetical protein
MPTTRIVDLPWKPCRRGNLLPATTIPLPGLSLQEAKVMVLLRLHHHLATAHPTS